MRPRRLIKIFQEKNEIWKNCKRLVFIISRVLSNDTVCLKLNFSFHRHFKKGNERRKATNAMANPFSITVDVYNSSHDLHYADMAASVDVDK